ncbi:MAG: tetratricopeptide repeat protein [candidate division KSB1 bacterium]|nr:tetratricopeptide repeat protein [candidate division KSB1 bacterium]MDZ7319493.1 tetratricopeptide repeat protein [candidate division KSB1 bacterium]MDZ7340994.1 tetratricopeptide repeat protein [candidate division KSB1 bacterium]
MLFKKNQTQRRQTMATYEPKALEHFIRGCTYELTEDYTNALLEFSEALLFDSSSATIYNKIAENYIRFKKLESAQQILQSAIRRFPQNIESHELLAAIYYSRRDFKSAEQIYRRIVAIDPKNIESRFTLITLFMAQGKELETAKEYENIIGLGYGTPEVRIKAGDIYLQNKQFKKAEKIFTKLYNDFPDDERSYLAMAKLSLANQDTLSAIAWYKKGLAKNSSFESCQEELLEIYRNQQQWAPAIELIQQAIASDTSTVENYLRLGELHFQRGDTAAAINQFEQTIERFPQDFRPYFSLGYLHYQRRHWEPAELYFQKALELNQEFSRSWITMGFIYLRNQKLEAAEEHFKKAVAALPDDPHINYLLGSVLNQRHKSDEAIVYLEKCLELNPNYVDALGTLAMIYDEKKIYSKSDSLYQAALSNQPNDALLMNNYSYSLSVRGLNLELAMEMAQKAVASDSTNGAYLDTLGWIYFKMGDYQNALMYILKAVKYRDNSAEVMEHLGDVYEKMNDLENARMYWLKSLELDSTRSDVKQKLEQK